MARRSSTGGGMLARVQRFGLHRGVFGASKGWAYVWGGLWLWRKLTANGSAGEILLAEELKPGQRIVIGNQRSTTGSGTVQAVRGRGGKVVPVAQLKGRKARKARKELAQIEAQQQRVEAKRLRSRKVRKAQAKADKAAKKARRGAPSPS